MRAKSVSNLVWIMSPKGEKVEDDIDPYKHLQFYIQGTFS